MIRVLFLLDELSGVGGTEKQLQRLIARMDRSRFSIEVMTLYARTMPHEVAFGGFACPIRTLDMQRVASVDGLRAVLRLADIIRRERFDIVQTNFVDASLVGILAGRIAGARVVVGRRDLGYWHTPRYLAAARILQRLASAYVVNSFAVKTAVAAAEGVKPSQICVIYNGFFFDRTEEVSTPIRKSLGFPDTAKIVGIVANLRGVKRIDRFVDMATRIADPDACFLIVGHGELRDALTKQAREAGLGDRLRIVHSIDRIMEITSQFHVGVLTSESEGLPNALIEYGFAGVPSIAFDVGGNREVIDDGQTGYLVAPYDVCTLSHRVSTLLHDAPLRDRMGARARVVCSDRFSGPSMVKRTQEFYEAVASERR